MTDFAALRRWLRLSSFVPAAGQPRHAPMLDALRALFAATAVDGVVWMEYATRVFAGRPA